MLLCAYMLDAGRPVVRSAKCRSPSPFCFPTALLSIFRCVLRVVCVVPGWGMLRVGGDGSLEREVFTTSLFINITSLCIYIYIHPRARVYVTSAVFAPSSCLTGAVD